MAYMMGLARPIFFLFITIAIISCLQSPVNSSEIKTEENSELELEDDGPTSLEILTQSESDQSQDQIDSVDGRERKGKKRRKCRKGRRGRRCRRREEYSNVVQSPVFKDGGPTNNGFRRTFGGDEKNRFGEICPGLKDKNFCYVYDTSNSTLPFNDTTVDPEPDRINGYYKKLTFCDCVDDKGFNQAAADKYNCKETKNTACVTACAPPNRQAFVCDRDNTRKFCACKYIDIPAPIQPASVSGDGSSPGQTPVASGSPDQTPVASGSPDQTPVASGSPDQTPVASGSPG